MGVLGSGRMVPKSSGGSGTGLQTGTGSPVGVVTPTQAGSGYSDQSTGILWVAQGTTSASWVPSGTTLTPPGQIVLPGGGTGNDAATVNQLPAAVPALSAFDAWGHSYLAGGTASPTAQQIGLMSRLLGTFHVGETNFTPMVSGGATVLVPSGQSQASWDALFQKRLPPTATGLIANNAGVTGQPPLQWPLTNGPLLLALNGFNDFAFGFQPYGIFSAFNFGVTTQFTGTYAAGTVTCTGVNNTTGGVYLPNRVGGAGIQNGDYVAGVGIRGYAKVSAVTFSGGNTTFTVPTAQITGSPTTFTLVPSRGSQAVKGLQNAFQGVIERGCAGAIILSTDTTNADTKFSYGGGTNAWAKISSENPYNTYVGFVGGTNAAQMMTYANNDTFTFTIDPKFPGGVIAVVLTGPVTSDLDNSGAAVNWSGTASAATGSTTIAGQGWVGQPVPVVKRFILTGADAGKTIIGTFSNGTPCNYVVSSVLNSTTVVTPASGSFPPGVTPGCGVSGTNIAAGTYVQAVNATSTQLTLSQAATGSSTTNLTFTSTVLQVDHASYESTYMSPVLLVNQPVVGPGGIFSPAAANTLDTAIQNAVSTFTSTPTQTVCGVVNNYSTIGRVDVLGAMSKRSFYLGTTLTGGAVTYPGLPYDTSSVTTAGVTLIGQRTTTQADQVAPFIGQYVSIPNANDGDVNEVCLITAVAATANQTITGGPFPAGTYPAWNVSILRGLQSFNNSAFISGNASISLAATGSTTAPTQGVYDLSWTQPLDFVHPGIGGAGLFASQVTQGYQAFANETPDWIGTANQAWAFGRTRSAPAVLNNGWWSHDGTFGAGTSNVITTLVFCQRFVTPVPIIVDQIGVDVTTAAATTKMSAGFFVPADGGSFPSTKILFDFGLNNVPMTNLGMLFCTGWELVPPGEYWVAVAFGNQGAGRCESMTQVADDFPQWRTSVPTAGNHHLGWQGSSQFSSGNITNLAPSTGWSTEATSFIPWIVVHAYAHTYLVGS